ncbi:hypothetical protein NCC49_003331 [Naganishia albida]|nr:hypothetical protein NCC49_003331 [Naganishia albida]
MLPTTVLSLAVAFLASSAQAIKVTAPTKSTVQASGSALQLTWDSVNTDPTSFAIVLVNQDSQFLANSPVTLVQNQSTSAGSASLTYPSGAWPTGTAFQVNLVKSTSETNSILAQSEMFNITGSASSSSSSAASSSASTSASSSSSAASSSSSAATVVQQSGASAVYSGNAQSTAAIPSAAPASGAISDMGVKSALALVGGALAVGAAVVGF